jgi:hypothetical protein
MGEPAEQLVLQHPAGNHRALLRGQADRSHLAGADCDRRSCGNYRTDYPHRCLFHIKEFVVKMGASTSIDREVKMLRT